MLHIVSFARLNGLSEPFARRKPIVFVDYLNRKCGFTEPFLWIQLVAEGSSSKRRALGVAMAKARRVNVEGSAFQ